MKFREEFQSFTEGLQDKICGTLELIDGKGRFREDPWQRPAGGGGRTRVMENGKVFEKAGVNTSAVFGEIPELLKKEAGPDAVSFFACGISLVIHPHNPFVPTTHANYRYFGLYNQGDDMVDEWFGGGADLTPYYLFRDDAVHFHSLLKEACDKTDPGFYKQYKEDCDKYFYNTHRQEGRGIGGIFFDHLRPGEPYDRDALFRFSRDGGEAFLAAYIPIVERRKNLSFREAEKEWQLIRRGRYVEFNLIHDRGTLFGLKTGGRIESILMSLPPQVEWKYNHHPVPGSREAELLDVLKNPVNWLFI